MGDKTITFFGIFITILCFVSLFSAVEVDILNPVNSQLAMNDKITYNTVGYNPNCTLYLENDGNQYKLASFYELTDGLHSYVFNNSLVKSRLYTLNITCKDNETTTTKLTTFAFTDYNYVNEVVNPFTISFALTIIIFLIIAYLIKNKVLNFFFLVMSMIMTLVLVIIGTTTSKLVFVNDFMTILFSAYMWFLIFVFGYLIIGLILKLLRMVNLIEEDRTNEDLPDL